VLAKLIFRVELFGIAFSVPAAFVASAIYRALLLTGSKRWPLIRPVFIFASCLVLVAILAEWGILSVRGAVGTRVLIGRAYYLVHLLVFFLGCPALINVMVLPNPSKWQARWWVVLPLCTALALVLVLQQYAVSEALYGIDGVDGPFSQTDRI
jgi:hypothetical protein